MISWNFGRRRIVQYLLVVGVDHCAFLCLFFVRIYTQPFANLVFYDAPKFHFHRHWFPSPAWWAFKKRLGSHTYWTLIHSQVYINSYLALYVHENSLGYWVRITHLDITCRLNARNDSQDCDPSFDISNAFTFRTGMTQESESTDPEDKTDQVRKIVPPRIS
jgi:hypothetical protein